jgi:hypothetical protein
MLGLTMTLLTDVHWGKPLHNHVVLCFIVSFFSFHLYFYRLSPLIFGVWLTSHHPPTQSPHNPPHLVGYPWLELLYFNHGIP